MIPLPCRAVVRAGPCHRGDPASECWRGRWNSSFIISPRSSDHLRMWFSGTAPTGAVGTPGKGTIIPLERDDFWGPGILFVHLFSKQNNEDGNWAQVSCISLTLNLGAHKNTLAPPPVGQWFSVPGLYFCYFFSCRRFCMENLVSNS